MNNSKMKKYYFVAAAIALLAVFIAAPAGAGGLDRRLYGDYTWNSTSTCAQSGGGFGATYQRLPNPSGFIGGASYNYALEGVLSFDGRGKVDFKGEVLSIMLEPYRDSPQNYEASYNFYFENPVFVSDLTPCYGEYTVRNDRQELVVEITFTSCKATSRTGYPVQEFSGAKLRGRLDTVTGSSTVFLNSTVPAPENINPIIPPGPPSQRICTATGSMVRLSPWHWFSNGQTDLPKPKK